MKIFATSALAIVAATGFLAMIGFISGGNPALLDTATKIVVLVVIGAIIIAAIIHGPRYIR